MNPTFSSLFFLVVSLVVIPKISAQVFLPKEVENALRQQSIINNNISPADIDHDGSIRRRNDIRGSSSKSVRRTKESSDKKGYKEKKDKKGGKKNDKDEPTCELMEVYLNATDVDVNRYLEGNFIGETGSFYGGQIPIYDSPDFSNSIGVYSFATKFMLVDLAAFVVTCIGNGAYTFNDAMPGPPTSPPAPRDQIVWTATCANDPFFTITGGQGKYLGAIGYLQFNIQIEGGFKHEIFLCE